MNAIPAKELQGRGANTSGRTDALSGRLLAKYHRVTQPVRSEAGTIERYRDRFKSFMTGQSKNLHSLYRFNSFDRRHMP